MRTREYDPVLHDHYLSACRAYDNAVTIGSAKDMQAAETARDVAQKAMDAEYEGRTNPPRAPVVLKMSAADVLKFVDDNPLPNIELVRVFKALAPHIAAILSETLGPIVERLNTVEEAVSELLPDTEPDAAQKLAALPVSFVQRSRDDLLNKDGLSAINQRKTGFVAK